MEIYCIIIDDRIFLSTQPNFVLSVVKYAYVCDWCKDTCYTIRIRHNGSRIESLMENIERWTRCH